jgi:hypothetical protein
MVAVANNTRRVRKDLRVSSGKSEVGTPLTAMIHDKSPINRVVYQTFIINRSTKFKGERTLCGEVCFT